MLIVERVRNSCCSKSQLCIRSNKVKCTNIIPIKV